MLQGEGEGGAHADHEQRGRHGLTHGLAPEHDERGHHEEATTDADDPREGTNPHTHGEQRGGTRFGGFQWVCAKDVTEHRDAGEDHHPREEEEARLSGETEPGDGASPEPGAPHGGEPYRDGAAEGDGAGAQVPYGPDEGGDADDGVAEDDRGFGAEADDVMEDGLGEDRATPPDESEDDPDTEGEEGGEKGHEVVGSNMTDDGRSWGAGAAEPREGVVGLPSMAWIPMVAVGLGGAVALLFTLWVLHRRWQNAGVVDIGWTLAIGMQAVTAAMLGTGDATRRVILGVIGGAWSLRLATHLIVRVAGKPEDPRYAELRARWGGNVEVKMLAFFLFQGVLATALASPFFVAAMDPSPTLHPVFLAGVALAVIAVVGESVADAQLRRFVADPATRGQVCRVGLWGWSRHPNYFFDWLSWCAFVLLALPSPFGWATIGSPLLMLYFLLKVTGIAATEAHAVRSRGEAYRRYQREVSAFVPWPPH